MHCSQTSFFIVSSPCCDYINKGEKIGQKNQHSDGLILRTCSVAYGQWSGMVVVGRYSCVMGQRTVCLLRQI